MDQWHIDMQGIRHFGVVEGVGLRVTIHVREHPRPRTQKKWDKRFGILQLTIPSGVMLQGAEAVRQYIRKARRLAMLCGGRR